MRVNECEKIHWTLLNEPTLGEQPFTDPPGPVDDLEQKSTQKSQSLAMVGWFYQQFLVTDAGQQER